MTASRISTTKFTLRGVPHVLAMRVSVASRDGPRTGWGGDGAPGDRTLRSFAVGAVIQHFPRTTNRVAGVDFRLPTEEELDALEAFMLSLGRQEDLTLPLALTDARATRGQTLFLDNNVARCNVCHFNAGANANPAVFGEGAGNLNFNTGVEDLPDIPSHVLGDPRPPRDDGLQHSRRRHLQHAAFGGGRGYAALLPQQCARDARGGGGVLQQRCIQQFAVRAVGRITLTEEQVDDIAAFLRVLNALENIRQAEAMLTALPTREERRRDTVRLAIEETQDAMEVLSAVGLHADAVADLDTAKQALAGTSDYRNYVERALAALRQARGRILAAQAPAHTSTGQ